MRQQVAQAANNHLEEVQFYGLLPSWFACEINHSHPRLPYRRPAEHLHLMRVNLSTSPDSSYAVGGYPSSEQYPWPKPVYYHICLELRRRGTDGQLSHKELEREASDILDMWEKRMLAGKPIPPVRRALEATRLDLGPTPAQLLLAMYNSKKSSGNV